MIKRYQIVKKLFIYTFILTGNVGILLWFMKSVFCTQGKMMGNSGNFISNFVWKRCDSCYLYSSTIYFLESRDSYNVWWGGCSKYNFLSGLPSSLWHWLTVIIIMSLFSIVSGLRSSYTLPFHNVNCNL